MPSKPSGMLSMNFYKIIFSKFFNASLLHCLTRSVKCSRKLAIATALLLRQKCLEFRGKETFTILNTYCHCSSVRLPSKVTLRFPASHQVYRIMSGFRITSGSTSCNNALQHMKMYCILIV